MENLITKKFQTNLEAQVSLSEKKKNIAKGAYSILDRDIRLEDVQTVTNLTKELFRFLGEPLNAFCTDIKGAVDRVVFSRKEELGLPEEISEKVLLNIELLDRSAKIEIEKKRKNGDALSNSERTIGEHPFSSIIETKDKRIIRSFLEEGGQAVMYLDKITDFPYFSEEEQDEMIDFGFKEIKKLFKSDTNILSRGFSIAPEETFATLELLLSEGFGNELINQSGVWGVFLLGMKANQKRMNLILKELEGVVSGDEKRKQEFHKLRKTVGIKKNVFSGNFSLKNS